MKFKEELEQILLNKYNSEDLLTNYIFPEKTYNNENTFRNKAVHFVYPTDEDFSAFNWLTLEISKFNPITQNTLSFLENSDIHNLILNTFPKNRLKTLELRKNYYKNRQEIFGTIVTGLRKIDKESSIQHLYLYLIKKWNEQKENELYTEFVIEDWNIILCDMNSLINNETTSLIFKKSTRR